MRSSSIYADIDLKKGSTVFFFTMIVRDFYDIEISKTSVGLSGFQKSGIIFFFCTSSVSSLVLFSTEINCLAFSDISDNWTLLICVSLLDICSKSLKQDEEEKKTVLIIGIYRESIIRKIWWKKNSTHTHIPSSLQLYFVQ